LLPALLERCTLDVLLPYRLPYGSIEVPGADEPPLAGMDAAALLHRWHVQQANLHVQVGGVNIGERRKEHFPC
jgi:hypothetical protein